MTGTEVVAMTIWTFMANTWQVQRPCSFFFFLKKYSWRDTFDSIPSLRLRHVLNILKYSSPRRQPSYNRLRKVCLCTNLAPFPSFFWDVWTVITVMKSGQPRVDPNSPVSVYFVLNLDTTTHCGLAGSASGVSRVSQWVLNRVTNGLMELRSSWYRISNRCHRCHLTCSCDWSLID